MPEVLALRLSGPLQSWGGHSRHNTRGTLTHPTKSGVVGLCAAALGRQRGADLSDLAGLDFGVRVDRKGSLMVDLHTVSAASHGPLAPRAQRLPTSSGGRLKPGEGKVSHRSYLQDAVFVAVLSAADEEQVALLGQVETALRCPRFPLFLGRRSCPPDSPVLLGRYRETGLISALASVPWQGAPWWSRRTNMNPDDPRDGHEALASLPIVVDDREGEELLPDVPLPGPAFDRVFGDRPVRHTRVEPPEAAAAGRKVPGEPDGPDFGFSGDGSMALLSEGDD